MKFLSDSPKVTRVGHPVLDAPRPEIITHSGILMCEMQFARMLGRNNEVSSFSGDAGHPALEPAPIYKEVRLGWQ